MKNILVVDDDPEALDFATFVLAPRHEVRTVASVGQCRAELQTRKPDLILLDAMISDLGDGLELTKELKAHPDTHAIPVVMITNVNRVYDYREEIDASYFPHDRWLDKPVKANVLLKTVEELLARDNAPDELPPRRRP